MMARRFLRSLLLVMVAAVAAKAEITQSMPSHVAELLRLMPEGAVAALIVPPLSASIERSAAVTERLLPPEVPALHQVLARFGIVDLRALPTWVRTKGLDPDAAAAVFISLRAVAADAAAVVAGYHTATDSLFHAANRPPAVVAVLACTDIGVAESALTEFARWWDPALTAQPTRRNQGDYVVSSLADGISYCFINGRLFLGNDLELLTETIARSRSSTPASVRLDIHPPVLPEDVLLLTRLPEAMDPMPDLAPLIAYTLPVLKNEAETEARRLSTLYAICPDPGFVATTLSVADDKIELLSRVSIAGCPLLAMAPDAFAPLQLAHILSHGDVLNVSARSTPVTRFLVDNILLLAPELIRSRSYYHAADLLRELCSQEIAARAVLGAAPSASFLAQVERPDTVEAALEGLGMPVRKDAAEPWALEGNAFPLFVMLRGSTLVISTSAGECTELAEAVGRSEGALFFASLDPPEQEAGLVALCRLNASGIPGAMELWKPHWAESNADQLARFSGAVREIRAGTRLEGPQQLNFLTCYLR